MIKKKQCKEKQRKFGKINNGQLKRKKKEKKIEHWKDKS